VLRGIRHSLGTAPARKTPATAELIAAMLAVCPDSLIDRRDRALLALGFAGALRRSELLALQVTDLLAVPDGLRVTIRRSKTDPDGQGQEIAIPRHPAPPGRGAADLADGRRDHRVMHDDASQKLHRSPGKMRGKVSG
jgi:integrase